MNSAQIKYHTLFNCRKWTANQWVADEDMPDYRYGWHERQTVIKAVTEVLGHIWMKPA